MNTDKLPRLLKEPTGWIMMILVVGFFYMQWPTHVRTAPEPEYYTQTLDNGFVVRWEQQPEPMSDAETQAWGLTRSRMSFLLQTGEFSEDFASLVNHFAEQDRKTVGGAVQEPLKLEQNYASYSFFDTENRIQEHRIYVRDGRWVKVSVLYSPSMESRVQRATEFWANIGFRESK